MLKYTANELEHMIQENRCMGEFIKVTDSQGYCEDWKFIVDGCCYEVGYSLLEDGSFEKQIAQGIIHQLEYKPGRTNMDKKIMMQDLFTQDQIQLLYSACLCYGDSLSAVNKGIYCTSVSKVIEARAKEVYELSVLITEGMNKTHTF